MRRLSTNTWRRRLSLAAVPLLGLLLTSVTGLAHEKGVLRLADRTLAAGASIQLAGEKLPKDATLTLTIVGVTGTVTLREVHTDVQGTFSTSVELPLDLAPGTYQLVAVAPDGDRVAAIDVEIIAPSAGPAGMAHDDMAGAAGMRQHEMSGHDEMPSAEPLALERARSPWLTGLASVAIALAALLGFLLLRPQHRSTPEETAEP